jgi:hypothetical protein
MSRRGAAGWILFATLVAMWLSAPVGAASSPVPTHAVGDKIGFGTSIDLGDAAKPILRLINEVDKRDPNITFHELQFGGTFDLWSTTEVVGKSADAYAIRTNSVLGFQVAYVVNVTSSKFPKAGTYPGNTSSGTCQPPPIDQIPRTTETLFADVNITYLLSTTALSSWTVSDFALQGEERNTSIEARGPAVYHNVPYFELNETACELSVSYFSVDATLAADVQLDLQTAYTPALDRFAFPIVAGETWSARSNVTMAGRIGGTFDVRGLDPDQQQEFFEHLHHALDSAGFSASGLSKFPIVFEDVSIMLGPITVLKDGVIHDITLPVDQSLHAQETSMTLADGKLHTVYLISEHADLTRGLCAQVYSPDDGFVVGIRCAFQGIPFFELPNVKPATAEERIADAKRHYSLRPSGGAVPEGSANVLIGVIAVAAVALGVVVIVVRRRMRPPPRLPPLPPEAPPPGGP